MGLFEMRVVRNDLQAVKGRTRQALRQHVRRTAANVEARAKVKIQTGPKTGRVYKRRKRVHQASAPGESPATDTGNLANSIHSRYSGPLEAEVVVGAEYGGPLEFGGAHVAARPFLGPAMEEEWPAFEAGIAQAIRDGANG